MKRQGEPEIHSRYRSEPWFETAQNALRFATRGRFRAGVQRLEKINNEHPREPAILAALGPMQLILGRRAEGIATIQELATLESLSFDEQAEWFAFAFALDAGNLYSRTDLVTLTWPVTDANRLSEIISSHPRIERLQRPAADAEGPQPSIEALVLDRDRLPDWNGEEFDAAMVPRAIAEIEVYGKRTDRPGEISLTFTETADLADLPEQLRQWLGSAIDDASTREVTGQVSEAENAFAMGLRLPRGTPASVVRKVVAAVFERTVLETWPNLPVAALDRQSPKQALAADPLRYRAQVAGLILNLENH
jgi:hypothetical protein